MHITNVLASVSPIAAVLFERGMFNAADRNIEGYNGGTWGEAKVGDYWHVIPPHKEGEKVHLSNAENYCDVTTDAKSAGAAITILMLNHLIWYFHERGMDREAEAINTIWNGTQEAVRNAGDAFDQVAIIRFLD